MAKRLEERWTAWCAGGAICSEMEAASIFVLSSIYRKRAGGIMLVCSNQETDDPSDNTPTEDITNMLAVAIEAIKTLIQQDKASGKI